MCRLHLRGDKEAEDRGAAQDTHELNAAEREILTFAMRLTDGTRAHQEEIDRRLQAVARNWDLRRMAIVDRNVLRMAVYELTWCDDVPPKVAINEAIEIGKKFSTANSGGFVNGILDRIRIDLSRRDADGVDAAAEASES
jgi:transcription antitermination factor NusB